MSHSTSVHDGLRLNIGFSSSTLPGITAVGVLSTLGHLIYIHRYLQLMHDDTAVLSNEKNSSCSHVISCMELLFPLLLESHNPS